MAQGERGRGVVGVEVAVFTYWTALLHCHRARGHDSAHVAK